LFFPKKAYVREVKPANYEINKTQPLLVDIEHLQNRPIIEVRLDHKKIGKMQ
jgi:hypothetical protein